MISHLTQTVITLNLHVKPIVSMSFVRCSDATQNGAPFARFPPCAHTSEGLDEHPIPRQQNECLASRGTYRVLFFACFHGRLVHSCGGGACGACAYLGATAGCIIFSDGTSKFRPGHRLEC